MVIKLKQVRFLHQVWTLIRVILKNCLPIGNVRLFILSL